MYKTCEVYFTSRGKKTVDKTGKEDLAGYNKSR